MITDLIMDHHHILNIPLPIEAVVAVVPILPTLLEDTTLVHLLIHQTILVEATTAIAENPLLLLHHFTHTHNNLMQLHYKNQFNLHHLQLLQILLDARNRQLHLFNSNYRSNNHYKNHKQIMPLWPQRRQLQRLRLLRPLLLLLIHSQAHLHILQFQLLKQRLLLLHLLVLTILQHSKLLPNIARVHLRRIRPHRLPILIHRLYLLLPIQGLVVDPVHLQEHTVDLLYITTEAVITVVTIMVLITTHIILPLYQFDKEYHGHLNKKKR